MKRIKIGIVGEFQAGKSTLINCLLGKAFATIGDGRATTHTIVNYLFSEKEYIEVEYIWGENEAYEFKYAESLSDSTCSILDKAIRSTPNVQFGIVGTQNGWGISEDTKFEAFIGDWVVLSNYEFVAGDEFKIRVNNDWEINYGMPYVEDKSIIREGVKYTLNQNGGNIAVPVGDSYNVYFNIATKELCLMKKGTIPIVKAINVYLDNQFLKHFSLVDMPGYGFNEEDNNVAKTAILDIDYAIVVAPNFKTIGKGSSAYKDFEILKHYKIPYYFVLNCVKANVDEGSWIPESDYNQNIAKGNRDMIDFYPPMTYPFEANFIPIVNLMWYWYSIQDEKDELLQRPVNRINIENYELNSSEVTKTEIKQASNFHLIEKIFSMENRMYLELKKEIKEEMQKLKDEVCPVGTIQAFAFERIPDGWMICDGRWLQILDYPELFGAIGHTFGKVDENSFKIPDLRGRFVRGWSKDGTTDKERIFGSLQTDAIQKHKHSFDTTKLSISEGGNHKHPLWCDEFDTVISISGLAGSDKARRMCYPTNTYSSSKTDLGPSAGKHNHLITSSGYPIGEPIKYEEDVRLASETRPTNVALLYCIKIGIHSEVGSFLI